MKKTLVLLLFSAKLFSQNITSDLVICMPMDNGLAQDISGNNNNGVTTSVVAVADRFGNPNSALQFFGNPSKIVVPSSTSLNNIETLQELTITSWCKVTSFDPTNCFPIANRHKVADNWGWDYTVQPPATHNGQILVMDYYAMGGNYNICKGNEGVTNNQWDFYAITFSKANSTFKVYKNTTLLNTVNTGAYGLEPTANGSLYIGCSPASTYDYANGFMDDFKMYSRALTQAEITMIYNGGSCLCSAPTNTGAINGTSNFCSNSTYIYSVAPIAGATSYTWGLPNGWTGISNTNTISAYTSTNAGVITVVASSSCGISATTSLTVFYADCGGSTVGIKTNLNSSSNILLSVYPNPNNGNFYIEYKNGKTPLNISIINLLGQEVYANKINSDVKNEINLQVKRGLYFIKIFDQSSTLLYQKKMMVD
jgi:hypothetical protein